MNRTDEIEGFVLAGGASSRMGTDKAELLFGGQTLFERAAQTLFAATGRTVTVVGGTARPTSSESVRTLPDIKEYEGREMPRAPIAGLFTALSASSAECIAVLACDLPFVTAELIQTLADRRIETGAAAAVPIQADGRPQPLCAIYERERMLSAIVEMLRAGDLKLRSLVSKIDALEVAWTEISGLAGADRFFINLNEPSDYKAAVSAFGSG